MVKKRGRPPLNGKKAMTAAERNRRYRAGLPTGYYRGEKREPKTKPETDKEKSDA